MALGIGCGGAGLAHELTSRAGGVAGRAHTVAGSGAGSRLVGAVGASVGAARRAHTIARRAASSREEGASRASSGGAGGTLAIVSTCACHGLKLASRTRGSTRIASHVAVAGIGEIRFGGANIGRAFGERRAGAAERTEVARRDVTEVGGGE